MIAPMPPPNTIFPNMEPAALDIAFKMPSGIPSFLQVTSRSSFRLSDSYIGRRLRIPTSFVIFQLAVCLDRFTFVGGCQGQGLSLALRNAGTTPAQEC